MTIGYYPDEGARWNVDRYFHNLIFKLENNRRMVTVDGRDQPEGEFIRNEERTRMLVILVPEYRCWWAPECGVVPARYQVYRGHYGEFHDNHPLLCEFMVEFDAKR